MIGGIILAAGSSRRYGDDKRKQILPSGNTVLVQSIGNAAAVIHPLVVVLRFGDQPFVDELHAIIKNPEIEFFRAPDSAKGMAHSLSNAIHHVHDWDAAIVLLGDMPYLSAETLQTLIDTYNANQADDPIVLPTWDGRPGHPVLFPKQYFPEIEALEGDVGAKAVLDAHPDKIIKVEVDDPGIIRDVDKPEDLAV